MLLSPIEISFRDGHTCTHCLEHYLCKSYRMIMSGLCRIESRVLDRRRLCTYPIEHDWPFSNHLGEWLQPPKKFKMARYPKMWQKNIFLVLFCGFYWQILEEREGVIYEVGGFLNVTLELNIHLKNRLYLWICFPKFSILGVRST